MQWCMRGIVGVGDRLQVFHCILASVLIVSCFITMVYVIIYNISVMSRTRTSSMLHV